MHCGRFDSSCRNREYGDDPCRAHQVPKTILTTPPNSQAASDEAGSIQYRKQHALGHLGGVPQPANGPRAAPDLVTEAMCRAPTRSIRSGLANVGGRR
ncbi:MAG: hypothetical protein QOF25_4619 [Mycobacterium sp.]|nr:hypothetical protein [Mycobacterium sp.]